MKFYGHAQEVADNLVAMFERGDIPDALAQTFLPGAGNVPSQSWSRLNRLFMLLSGTEDARGFNQWKEVGRSVKKGGKALHILAPLYAGKGKEKDKPEGEEKDEKSAPKILYGFKSVPVFRIEDTEIFDADLWAQADAQNASARQEQREFLDSLPLLEVAQTWGLDVRAFGGSGGTYLGAYAHGQYIELGTKNLSTWAHELIHAADDRAGNLTAGRGQKMDNEIVAEFGGAVLLRMMGYETESDAGGAYEYCLHYCGGDKDKLFGAVRSLINRTIRALELIVETAQTAQNCADKIPA